MKIKIREMVKQGPEQLRAIAARYRIERELGWGGRSTVYLAQDLQRNGRRVALKVAELQEDQDAGLIASLKNEFAALSLLQNPNLARVYDFGQTEKEIYFSSEWVDGTDMLRATRRKNLNTIFQLLLQLLRAVDFLHRRGVLHLDLKPANILVTDPDRTGNLTVKLIDFGISEWRQKGIYPSDRPSPDPYSPPEMKQGEPVTPVSNLYSLGIIFFQILFNRLLPENRQPLFHPALPEEFSSLLYQMTAPNPPDRFQSVADVLAAINHSLDENFSLRAPTTPIRILEESDYLFRGELAAELVEAFSQKVPLTVSFSGPQGIGKTHLTRRVKETLQLKGIQPYAFLDSDALSSAPIPEKAPTRRIELPPLSEGRILDFLQNEMADIPLAQAGRSIVRLSEGLPAKLESVLQALREAGAIQWSDQGWRFQTEIPLQWPKLLSQHEALWNRRLQEVQEVLKFSEIGLDAKILEGILGLEAGALEEKLSEWLQRGDILRSEADGRLLYSTKSGNKVRKNKKGPTDWNWMERELTRLYDRGEHKTGVNWVDLIFSKDSDLPPRIALLAARHYVAGGFAKKGLETLPQEDRLNDSDLGLFHEVKSRAQFYLGDIEKAQAALAESRSFYEQIEDREGLTRTYNLEGTLNKKIGNFEKAEQAFHLASQSAAAQNNPYAQAISEMNLGTLFQDRGQYERADETYRRVFSLAERVEHPQLACTLRHNWVNLLHHLGRATEAKATCFEWLNLAIRSHYPQQQAAALNYLSLFAEQEGHRERQLAYLHQAISLLKPDQHPALLAQIYINRSYAYWENKKYLRAELDAEAALNLSEKTANRSLLALACLALGKVLRDRPHPNLKEASELLTKSHGIISERKILPLLWEVNFERGVLAKKLEDKEGAKGFFRAAKESLEQLIGGLPEERRQGFLRDRKLEKIEAALESI